MTSLSIFFQRDAVFKRALLALLPLAMTCPAAAFTVTIPSGDTTALIAAINNSNTNGPGTDDVINLTNSTYLFTDDYTNSQNALPEILSATTSGRLTINGNGATITRSTVGGTPIFRFFQVNGGANLTLNNLTLTNGSVSGLPSPYGGAIRNFGTLRINGCTLSGNYAQNAGGAVSNENGSAALQVIDSTLASNSSPNAGGAIYNNNNASLRLFRSTLHGNSATGPGDGGAIYTSFSTAIITFCSISGNSAIGGIGGGAIYGNAGSVTLNNSSVVGNSMSRNGFSTTGGGGLQAANSVTYTLNNSIVLGNTATLDGVAASSRADCATSPGGSGTYVGNYALTGEGTGGPTGGTNRNVASAAAVLNTNLANHGGPTQTHALVGGSLAIDAGSNALIPTGILGDQRGYRRSGTVDIGSYEFGAPANSAPQVVNNTGVTLAASSTATLGSSQLQITDTDSDTITYTIQGSLSKGILKLNSVPLSTGGSFTQADINAGRVSLSAAAMGTDILALEASDGYAASMVLMFNVNVVAPLTLGQPASIPGYWVNTATGQPIELAPTGGVGPYSIVAGSTSLPPGMNITLDSSGRVSLIFGQRFGGPCPPTAGTFPTTVTVEDAVGQRASVTFDVFVSAENPITITTPANTILTLFPSTGTGSRLFSDHLSAGIGFTNQNRVNDNPASGVSIIASSTDPVISGALSSLFVLQLVPDGVDGNGVPLVRMVCTSRTGVPLPTPGIYQLRIDYQYYGLTFSDTNVTMVVLGPRSLGEPTRTTWTVNRPNFASAVPIINAPPDPSNRITILTGLPAGLDGSISNGQVVLSGIPTETGSFPVNLTVTNTGSPVANAASTSFTLHIHPAPTLGALSVPTAELNGSYTGSIPINNGTATFTNLAVSGLPPGINAALSADSRAVELSGLASNGGDYDAIQISVTDATGAVASGTFALSVAEASSLTVTMASDAVDSLDGQTSLREAISTAANLPQTPLPTITFASSLSGSVIRLQSKLSISTGLMIEGDINSDSLPDITISGDANGDDIHVTGSTTITDPAATESAGGHGDNVPIIEAQSTSGPLRLNGLILTGGATNIVRVFPRLDATVRELTISNSIIRGNFSNGISTFQCPITVKNSNISGNLGNGIFTATGAITLANSIVSNNSSYGIADIASGNTTVINSTISGHSAGTGIYSGRVIVINSTITGSSTGGIDALLSTTLINSTISGNSNASHGGGISSGDVTLIHSTVSGNSAPTRSGGGVRARGSLTLHNSIVLGNTAQSDPELTVAGSILAEGLNIVGTGSDTDATDHIINAASLGAVFASGTLADHGGQTQTIALKAGGPAIDAGADVTTLSSAVADALTTTVHVAEASAFPAGVDFVIQIESEQMIVTDKSANTLTVVRGANGTTAAAHAGGGAVNPAFDQRGSGFARAQKGNAASTGARRDLGAYELFTAPSFSISALTVAQGSSPLNLGTAVAPSVSGGTFSGPGVNSLTGVFNPAGLAPGSYTLTYTVNDGFGGSNSSTFTVTISAPSGPDRTPPALVITAPSRASAHVPSPFDIAGTVKDDAGFSGVTVKFNGASVPLDSPVAFAPNTPMPFQVSSLLPRNGRNSFEVKVVDLAGRSMTITRPVTYMNMRSGLSGTFEALVEPTAAPALETSGVLSLYVQSSGAFSGRVILGGASLPFTGLLANEQTAEFGTTSQPSFELRSPSGASLGFLSFTVDAVTGLSGEIANQVTGGTALATFSSPKVPHSGTNPVPDALLTHAAGGRLVKGLYTMVLGSKAQVPPQAINSYPQGDGSSLVTLSYSGGISLTGWLADGTTFATSGKLREDASAVLFVQLYARQGALAGEVEFANLADSDVAGTDVLWLRPAQSGASHYAAGWPGGVRVDAVGVKYPAGITADFGQGANDLANGNVRVDFTDGRLTAAQSFALSIHPVSGLVRETPLSPNYDLVFSPGTGVMTGSFLHTGGTRVNCRGMLLNKGANRGIYGYFLSPGPNGEGGSMYVDPAGP